MMINIAMSYNDLFTPLKIQIENIMFSFFKYLPPDERFQQPLFEALFFIDFLTQQHNVLYIMYMCENKTDIYL